MHYQLGLPQVHFCFLFESYANKWTDAIYLLPWLFLFYFVVLSF